METRGRRRLLFLDRDGVLNQPCNADMESERAPWNLGELNIVPCAPLAVSLAIRCGLLPIVVTNQPDVAKGKLALHALSQINEALSLEIPGIERIYVCPHQSSDGCLCRKPKPGLLIEACEKFGGEMRSSWLIGDRWVDVAAAEAAGCRSVLIERERSWIPNSSGFPSRDLQPNLLATNVYEAVVAIASIPPGI